MTITHNPVVSGLSWTVFSGDRETVFLGLGSHFADTIHGIRNRSGEQWQTLLAKTGSGLFHQRLHQIIASTKRLCPVESFELEIMARGADMPPLDLWTYNLRGDLGRDDTGCSDIALSSDSTLVIGHNEDGAGQLAEDVCLITLRIEGDPDCTVLWYPGFLPANSFVATSMGMVWGMDHVPVALPHTDGAGRHFVARHGQRQHTGAAAREAAASIPCAGGFSFNTGDRDGNEATMIENLAGYIGTHSPSSERGCAWHTNHLRFSDRGAGALLIDPSDQWITESHTRGSCLAAALGPDMDAQGAFDVLRSAGVLNRHAEIYTLATTVADLYNDTVRVQGRSEPWLGRLSAFARGEHSSLEA